MEEFRKKKQHSLPDPNDDGLPHDGLPPDGPPVSAVQYRWDLEAIGFPPEID